MGSRRPSEDPFRRDGIPGLGFWSNDGPLLEDRLPQLFWVVRPSLLSDQIEDPSFARWAGTCVVVIEVLGGDPTTFGEPASGPILGELFAFNSEIGAGREDMGAEFSTLGAECVLERGAGSSRKESE